MRELSRNELILLRGILYTKRMYRGMKHIPHDIVIWEDWMEDTLTWVNQEIEKKYPDTPKWK
tara:strand:+ start:226 stop:411 length:186 start_codon:yes stop_codon:yes gene_type:complete